MNLEQIKSQVKAGESETLEFKRTTGARREAAKTMCAMLNQRGGCILFGIEQSGKVVGQEVSEQTIERLSAEFQRIEPSVFPAIERIQVGGDLEVLAVEVKAGRSDPYVYRGLPYRRVGNTTIAVSSDEYKQMILESMHSRQRWENQVAANWSIDDLDESEIFRVVSIAIQRGMLDSFTSRDPIDMLRGLRLIQDGQLLQAAVVLYGNTERIEFDYPQCLLRTARFRGLDRTEISDNRQYRGNAFKLFSDAERFLRDHLPIASRFEEGRSERIDEPLYPWEAIREALANAFCHRDYLIPGGSVGVAVYDDRLEITSSGSLHFGLTPEKLFLPHDSQPWNPLIARSFFLSGIIEEWGRGTIRIAEWLSDAGLPNPEIEDAGGCVTVRFRHNSQSLLGQHVRRTLPERQADILHLLSDAADGLSFEEISSRVGSFASERQIRRALDNLREQGKIVSSGRGRTARWKIKQD